MWRHNLVLSVIASPRTIGRDLQQFVPSRMLGSHLLWLRPSTPDGLLSVWAGDPLFSGALAVIRGASPPRRPRTSSLITARSPAQTVPTVRDHFPIEGIVSLLSNCCLNRPNATYPSIAEIEAGSQSRLLRKQHSLLEIPQSLSQQMVFG